MSASSDAVSVLRAHDPAQHLEPLSPDSRETLRDRVLSTAAHTCPAVRPAPRRRRAISLALAAVGALVVGVGAAWAAGALSPTAIFLNSPQQQDVAPGSLWDQHVVPSSVVQASTVDIPKVGRVGFWFARTEEGGWCGALRLPNGAWLGTFKDSRDAGGTAPGCFPTRAAVNNAGSRPVYELNGFDYQEALVDARADGGLSWRIRFGEIDVPGAVKVVDTVSGRSAPVDAGHLFALAIEDPHPESATRIHLVAYDANGNIVADDQPNR